MKEVKVQLLRENAKIPERATPGSAGYDLAAALDYPQEVAPGRTTMIPTGIAIELPEGTAALIFGRSGLGLKHGVAPANAVGVIDSDYRGEILVGLTCLHETPYTVMPGERIAQMVLIAVETSRMVEASTLTGSDRGAGGFGSTGTQ